MTAPQDSQRLDRPRGLPLPLLVFVAAALRAPRRVVGVTLTVLLLSRRLGAEVTATAWVAAAKGTDGQAPHPELRLQGVPDLPRLPI